MRLLVSFSKTRRYKRPYTESITVFSKTQRRIVCKLSFCISHQSAAPNFTADQNTYTAEYDKKALVFKPTTMTFLSIAYLHIYFDTLLIILEHANYKRHPDITATVKLQTAKSFNTHTPKARSMTNSPVQSLLLCCF